MTSSAFDPSAASPPRPPATRLALWWLAARPKTLPAAAAPVLVGSACAFADGHFAWRPALAALAGALALQIAANFANDVFDYEKGADTHARVGPVRAVQAGWVSPAVMRRALAAVIALALLIGAYLTSVAGPIIVGLGLVSIAAALAYTGGPYPLGYNGLGDICVFIFFGLVAVAGTYFVQAGRVSGLAWLASVPIGCLATAILVVNNVRDAPTDTLAGKRTLVVRWGRGFGIWEYRALLASAYASPIALVTVGELRVWALLPWLSAPLALGLWRQIDRARGAALNVLLARTGMSLFVFGVLLALGIVTGSRAWPASS